LKEAGFITNETLEMKQDMLLEIVKAVKPRLSVLADVKKEAEIFFNDDIEIEEEAKEALTWETTPKVLRAFMETLDETGGLTKENFKEAIKQIQKMSGAKGKFLYMPLRIGVTGQAHGMEMELVLTILTKEQMQRRLQKVERLIGEMQKV
jgi:nondiscriminating glutamyl-tRNA synthetase